MEIKKIEKEIERKIERIAELEEGIKKIDDKISEEERSKSRATTDATTGLFMMHNNSAMGPYGTYKYISGTMKGGVHRSNISELKSEKQFKMSQLYDERRALSTLRYELDFESRPDAVLVDTKDGVFIEGDKSKNNMLEGIYGILNRYVAEYNEMVSSKSVKKYCELSSQIMQDPGYENLPKDKALDNSFLRMSVPYDAPIEDRYFDHVVVGDRVVVGRDFLASSIKSEQDMIKYYTKKIEEQKTKAGMFQPRGLGVAFPKVRQRQEEEFAREIEYEIKACERRIAYAQEEIGRYEEYRSKYITPSQPFFGLVKELAALKKEKDVGLFVKTGMEYRENIQNQTILKNSSDYGDYIARAIEKAKPVLDKLGVKLTREQLLAAIYSSENHVDLIAELKNAGYKLTQPEAEKVQAAQHEKE